MFLPATLIGFASDQNSSFMLFVQKISDPFTWQHSVIFAVLIIVFTFFYTAITIPVNQMADDLKRNGGIIPGIKPGKDTAEYLDDVLSKITLPGSRSEERRVGKESRYRWSPDSDKKKEKKKTKRNNV